MEHNGHSRRPQPYDDEHARERLGKIIGTEFDAATQDPITFISPEYAIGMVRRTFMQAVKLMTETADGAGSLLSMPIMDKTTEAFQGAVIVFPPEMLSLYTKVNALIAQEFGNKPKKASD